MKCDSTRQTTSAHGFKYRAAYAIDGVRVVGFDNERGAERSYTFVSVEQLIEDFIVAVDAERSKT